MNRVERIPSIPSCESIAALRKRKNLSDTLNTSRGELGNIRNPLEGFWSVIYRGITGGRRNEISVKEDDTKAAGNDKPQKSVLFIIRSTTIKEADFMNNLQLIEKILYYIDKHLDESITFEYLAEKFNYSAFHFHRIFSAVTGQSITDYLKKRRLMYAYKDLLETEKTITDICYTYGFNSIQTFNRLFKETYSVIPSDLRKSHRENTFRSIDTILTGYKKRVHFKGDFITEPRIINREEFTLAGFRKHTGNGFQIIGESWQELKANMDKIPRANPNTMYGFEDYSEDFCREPLQFYYMAAVEVERDTNIPKEMYVKKVPKSLYAVFSVNGNNTNDEIYKAFQYIYNVWLPNSEYCLSDELCADFEYYDERWNCQSASSQIDIYIPIKKIVLQ